MLSANGENPANQHELDLVSVIDTVLSNRYTIALITVCFVLFGTAWAFLSHPQYQADILVQVEDGASGAANGVLGDITSLFDVKSSAAAEAQILASRLVVTRTVDALRLYIDASPKRFPVIGDFVSRFNHSVMRPGVFGIGAYAWGEESVDIARFDVPKDLEDDKFALTIEADGGYRLSGSDLDAPVSGRVGIESTFSTRYGPIQLRVTNVVALPGTRFTLIRRARLKTIGDLQSALDVQEKVKQSGVIVATLAGGDPQMLRRTLQEIADQYARQNIERKSADAAQSLSFLHAQLPELKKRLEAAEQRYTTMRNASGTVDLTEEAKLALQQSAESKTELLTLQQKRAELATRFNAAHPGMVAIDRQIDALRQQQGVFDRSLARLPDIQQQAARLMLDVKVDTDLYTALLNNAQQLELIKAGKVGSIRVVDTPVAPEDPVAPKRVVVIAGAALAGLVVGLAFAFARDLLFGGMTTADEIERGIGLDVFASIPFSAAQNVLYRRLATASGRVHLLAHSSPGDAAVESLRSLRTALHFSRVDGQPASVLITGAAPGAGKSFVAANLAAVLAAGGKRVLIVDGDLRRGYLNQYMGARQTPGLADLIAGTADESAVLQHLAQPRLDFIAAGAITPHVDELLMSERTGQLIDGFRARYDYVLIDAPPVLAVADAALLGRHANVVLLVAKAAETRLGELRESVKRLEHAGVKASGIVLNGIAARSARYAYGSKYGSYRYTYYDYGVPADRVMRRSWLDRLRAKRSLR
ncbi:MAG TPA: polysaccharide biosynthesis tyrosine autokinase [Paraburkholderia sp.]